MERLSRDIRGELGRLGGPDGGDLAAVAGAWPELVGEQNARRSWPARIGRDGTLVVHAADSVWAHQLGMLGPEILERLRERLEAGAAPAAIRFVPGPLPAPADVEPSARPQPVQAAPEDREEAAALTAGMADEELRELVARAAAASLARGRSSRRF
jgi:hypothetical protein